MIEFVYAYFTTGMYNVTFRQDNPYMGNMTSAIIEKSQIARLALFRKINGPPLHYLLARISEQPYTGSFEDHLCETGTVNAKW
jgi:hypothetical protein